MGTFEIYKNKSAEYRFRLKTSNGQSILASEGYSSKSLRDKAIESVRKNSQDEKRYKKGSSDNSKFYFNLTAANGKLIGKSAMYDSEVDRDNGIENVMKNTASFTIVES